ncbi:MAG: anti-sigma factor [Saprospiraceae bacterium]|nr:anti-sigma factor [Saprospiraceae bacterium]
MDIQSYISSGVLELYVIGQLSPREMRAVEKMAAQHPAVKKELTAIEQALEAYSLKNQTAPKAATFDKIKSEIQAPANNSVKNKRSGLPIWLGFLLGALGLMLAIAFFNARQQQKNLQVENEELNIALQQCETLNQDQLDPDRPMAIFRADGNSSILLAGTEANPDLQAVVYFNPLSQKSYLDPFQLPTPISGKQYQLWALINSQPTDMGVFDLPTDGQSLIEVPHIAEAEGFAITLEPEGGSAAPTLSDMQVIGNRS